MPVYDRRRDIPLPENPDPHILAMAQGLAEAEQAVKTMSPAPLRVAIFGALYASHPTLPSFHF